MGSCCSSDVTPDIPKVIQPDPENGTHFQATVVNLGSWGSRDYGVYKGAAVPATDEAKIEQMWFWLNKSSDPNDPRLGIVDVENFNRPADQPKGKGGVIWSAKLTERPRYEMDRYFIGGDRQRARMGQAATMSFRSGFLSINISQGNTNGYNSNNYRSTGYDSDDDETYFKHSYFNDSRRFEQFRHENYEDRWLLSQEVGYKKERAVGPKVMTKWMLNTQAVITAGNTGRTGNYILEVFSKGTAITTWVETVSVHERNCGPENQQVEKYVKRETKGSDAKFVDRIEFCLKCGDDVKATWCIIGDSSEARCSATSITDATPLYTAVTNGGFWKRSSLTVNTQGPVDGALALLIAQLAASEFSISELKNDLNLHTNSHFPRTESELQSRFRN